MDILRTRYNLISTVPLSFKIYVTHAPPLLDVQELLEESIAMNSIQVIVRVLLKESCKYIVYPTAPNPN